MHFTRAGSSKAQQDAHRSSTKSIAMLLAFMEAYSKLFNGGSSVYRHQLKRLKGAMQINK